VVGGVCLFLVCVCCVFGCCVGGMWRIGGVVGWGGFVVCVIL